MPPRSLTLTPLTVCGHTSMVLARQLLRAASVYYGAEAPTNNTAEGSAMLDCLKLIDDVEWQPSWQGVVVKGDSSLIVSFM